jgi:hypothetical protein
MDVSTTSRCAIRRVAIGRTLRSEIVFCCLLGFWSLLLAGGMGSACRAADALAPPSDARQSAWDRQAAVPLEQRSVTDDSLAAMVRESSPVSPFGRVAEQRSHVAANGGSPLPLPPIEPGSPPPVGSPGARYAMNPYASASSSARDAGHVRQASSTALINPAERPLPDVVSPEGQDDSLAGSTGGPTGNVSTDGNWSGELPTAQPVGSTRSRKPCGDCNSAHDCRCGGGSERVLRQSSAWSRLKHKGRACPDWYEMDFLARGYYLNDQRVEWSGLEATFGAEAAFAPKIHYRFGSWETTFQGEFYLNQPFDRNRLVDTPERESYIHNFDYQTFEISQLAITCRNGDFAFAVGKVVTPFGRVHFPLYSNSRLDAPFIRTEAILWRETGLLFRWDPGCLVADVALTNGGPDCDANSSKGLVSRIGIDTERFAIGASVKVQDGIGSEGQKQYNNHCGVDAMIRRGPFVLSAEAIYDEYGLRRPGLDPNDITWGRSIYYRDRNYRRNVPLTGVGYYVNLGIEGDTLVTNLNYGEYYPTETGDPQHDRPNRRGIAKVDYYWTPCLQMYAVVIMETEAFIAQAGRKRRGTAVLGGVQYVF